MRIVASFVIGLLWLPGCARADAAFPERAVRMIVGYPSGDTGDLIARVISLTLAESLGQSVIVEDHPGANSNLAIARVAKARPDGYTVLLASTALATNPALYPQLAQQPLRDLAPVSRVAAVQNVLLVNAAIHAKTLQQFIAWVRGNPGKLVFASAGKGSLSQLAAELMKIEAGPLNMLHVPYRGSGPALTELVGGHVDAMIVTMPYAFPQVKNGRLRGLAVGGLRRSPALPEVMTFDEAGVRGYEAVSWYALVVPAATHYDTVVRLNLAAMQVAKSAVAKQRLAAMGGEPAADTPDQLAQYLRAEIAKWARVVKRANVTLE